jgi:flagellar hook-length control protein FliK
MMQNVATAKSEVAAFTTGSGSNSFADGKSNEQFGKLLQKSTEGEKRVPSSGVKEDATTQKKTTLHEHSAQNTHLSQGKNADKNNDVVSAGITHDFNDNRKGDNKRTESDSLSKQNTKKSEPDVESANIVAQEWVLLVDNLQKLADIAQLTDRALVDVDGQFIDKSPAEVSSPDKGLFEHITNGQMADKLEVITDDVVSLPIEDKKVTQSLSMLIDEALGDIINNAENAENAELSESDIQQKVTDVLLKQPAVLQDLLSKTMMASQKNGIDEAEQKTPDLTLAENKALLRALLTDSEIDKTNPSEKLLQFETLITEVQLGAEQGELIEQDVQPVKVTPNSSKTEKVTSNVDINNILNLTDNKLEKVLENIAQRLFDSQKAVELISPEQIAQTIVIPKTAGIISSVESASKEFISVLKSGLEEFKNQLSQGREPGIDLKALVSDALAKVSDKEAVAKTPVNLEPLVKSVSQLLDFAQTMNRAIEHHHDQTYSATLKDVVQIHGEQSKQIQLNQFESKFEKAINISKSEGHQQLAEKVRWMVNTKNLVAEIRLDPAELGSVNVKVALSGESVTVNFVVQSQQARDAVDTATPKLREMLAEKGIELGQSSVHQENGGQQSKDDGELANKNSQSQDEFENVDVPEEVFAQQNIVNGALGGIDYFV